MGEPEQVITATSAFKAESDALGRFIGDKCLTVPGVSVRSSELFTAWSKWCAGEGEDPGTQTAFSLALTNCGYDSRRTATGIFWQGLGLASE
jgi:putative DNA primase/helicase